MNMHAAPTPTRRRVEFAAEVEATSSETAVALALAGLTNTRFTVIDLPTGLVEHIDLSRGEPGTNPYTRRAGNSQVPRSLREGVPLRTRSGCPAEIITVYDDELLIRISEPEWLSTHYYHKSGRGNPGGPEDPLDVLEVNPEITRWVRLYDRKLNEAGKQVVSGKEFAAERGLFMYVFDTEEEARANLRGVRAVFPITYREGEGLG